jgi:site-specific recombinase XerD
MGDVKEPIVCMPVKERVDASGRRWVQDLEKKFDNEIKRYRKESDSKNKNTIIRFLEDMRIGDSSKECQKRIVSKSRCLKILGVLRKIDIWLHGKRFDEVTVEDMKDMIYRLQEDIISATKAGKPYTMSTKASMKKIIRKFWKWLKGKNHFYPDIVEFISTYEPTPTMEVYSIEEIEFLRDNLHSFKMKVLLWVLFDIGVRISELLNIRIMDITEPTPEENYYKIYIRKETAKNGKDRVIGLLYSNQYLEQYLKEHHASPRAKKSFLFDMSYDYIKNYLHLKGKKFLNKSVNLHKIRASSATHFAPRIKSYQSFCYKYGWSLSSRVPDRYFNTSGVKAKDAMDQVLSFERDQIRNQYRTEIVTNRDLLDQNFLMQEKLKEYDKVIRVWEHQIKENIDLVTRNIQKKTK